MKRKLLIGAACLLTLATARAQDASQKLTLPSSPAFSILDYEPTAVLKPTDGKELATDVLNSFDKDGKLLMNLGLEVQPYWLQSHPTLTRRQYLQPSPGQAFLQSLSLSAATVKDSATGANRLGTGFRFKLLNGQQADSLAYYDQLLNNNQVITTLLAPLRNQTFSSMQACLDAVAAQLNASAAVTPTQRDWVNAKAKAMAPSYTADSTQQFITQLIESQVSSFAAIAARVSELQYQRKGFILEFAGATAFNTTSKNNLDRLGVWANASNYVSATDLFVATARYMWHNADTTYSNFDLGLSYVKQGANFNVSVEALLRWYNADVPDRNMAGESILRSEKKFTYRLAANGSYAITKDLSVNVSFGKNFDSPFLSGSSFFSILGVNYSIFKYPAIK